MAARSSKIASLNRLQRSFVAERVTAVSKDSTVDVAEFFSAALSLIDGFLRAQDAESDWRVSVI